MLLYALTIFVSAFLLFQVQPIIAKIILPWFGGSAAVWTTAMMFFQVALLGGYLYAYAIVRWLKPRRQAIVHITLLAASLLVLPILPSAGWKPASEAAPTARILALLAATIGLPYFLLSTTGPLLQAWFVRTREGAFPYRLYALSNLGSMLALLGFPFVVEPLLSTKSQGLVWSMAYGAFVLLCAVTAWRGRGAKQLPPPATEAIAAKEQPGWTLVALWTLLAACASMLLLGVTSHMTQNIAPVPFLWVVPLSLYLLSFILCFDSERYYKRDIFLPLLAAALVLMTMGFFLDVDRVNVKWQAPGFALGLFLCCMCCHGELAALKPHPRYLTLFYLMISVGGALGGLFVGLGAPRLFTHYLELPIAMVLCAAVMSLALMKTTSARWLPIAGGVLTIAIAVYGGIRDAKSEGRFKLSARNFYGVLSVKDADGERMLYHGVISHGQQLLDDARRRTPTSYYGPKSGVGRAILAAEETGPARIGVIGLGAGTLAAYGRATDTYRFYEINPLVCQVANSEFTFLKDCPADKQVLLGDARLTLERQTPQGFQVLAVDAFSSDSVPVHLLTRQAFSLYFQHLHPGGVLAVHVSNRYLDLVPIVARNADELGRRAMVVEDEGEDADYLSATTWVLLSDSDEAFHRSEFAGASMEPAASKAKIRTWTDDYSNLFQVLK